MMTTINHRAAEADTMRIDRRAIATIEPIEAGAVAMYLVADERAAAKIAMCSISPLALPAHWR